MGHSENRARRALSLPLQPRAKLIGLSILIAGFASLITSAQLDPIMAQVERVIDGDTVRVIFHTVAAQAPSRSEPSLFNWKNKRGGEGSAYGIAAEIAGFRTRPPAAGCPSGRLAFRTKSPRSIDRKSPVTPQR